MSWKLLKKNGKYMIELSTENSKFSSDRTFHEMFSKDISKWNQMKLEIH